MLIIFEISTYLLYIGLIFMFIIFSELFSNQFFIFSNYESLIIYLYKFALYLMKTTWGPNMLNYSYIWGNKLNWGHKKLEILIPWMMTLLWTLLSVTMIPLLSFLPQMNMSFCFSLSFTFYMLIVLEAIKKHGYQFLNMFLPKGVSLFIAPLMIFIELTTFVSSPISLGLRLFVNIWGMHVISNVIHSWTIFLGLFALPLDLILGLMDFGICLVQSLVFVVLILNYMKNYTLF